MTVKDRQGNALTGATTQAAELFDRAVEAFNLYRGDPMALLDQAIAVSPEFGMAHVTKAQLMALTTEPEATGQAQTLLARARGMPLSEREAGHLRATELLAAGQWNEAALALDRHNALYPRDLLALQIGHLADFFRGNARDMRDRIARALPAWSTDTPGRSYVLGFYAFGLEETGDYARAEEAGRTAVAQQPLDCWAHHAVAHVMEMQGRAEDGIGWMIARQPHWAGDDNFFKVHNWWHRALFHLDLGQTEEVLALYDGPIRRDHSAVAIDLIDASALLWRLQLTGIDVGDRWKELARTWDRHANGRTYPFNDLHAVMAYLGSGRDAEVDRILESCRNGPARNEAGDWAKRIALPLVEGFTAFWRGDHALAVERLHGIRYAANAFGGSHAQRDIIDWTLTEAAVRGRIAGVAEALANERLALKPHSPVNRRFLERARAGESLLRAA